MPRQTPPNSLPSGTVTFLFTDMEGSAGLAQQYPAEMPAWLEQQEAMVRQCIQAASGAIFHTIGDSFCAAFSTAAGALQAALCAQRQLQQGAWSPGAVKVRMGVHTGPAQPVAGTEKGADYSGYLTLTRAQRVMAAAHGGQILVSSASAELLRGELPEGVDLRDLGEHHLKGLVKAERLWQVTAPGLPSEFPALETTAAIPNNLPSSLSKFIGREREIGEVRRLLDEARLVTLTGVGGVGKSRLSLQAAAESLGVFKDGAWLIELAPLADPALLAQTVAAGLGLRDTLGRSVEAALLDYLRAKSLLLILDNCEHLISACAGLAETILAACPQARILASSREALGIAGERIYQVPSLGLPDRRRNLSPEEASRSESVQLFLECARSVQPGFALTASNAEAIVQICQRLDGIPLAIELAAARARMFSAEQILGRLDDRFRLLTGGSRTALPRQQTLHAAIDWSYELLDEAERTMLRRLSVFSGGWTYEAAEAVVEPPGSPPLSLLDTLSHLIEKSLVLVDEVSTENQMRYRFLETIRQYAGEKLVSSGEAAEVRDRHLAFSLHLAESVEPKLMGHGQVEALDQLEMEHDNLRAALAWGLEHNPDQALRLSGAVGNFWSMRGYSLEGQAWVQAAIERAQARSSGPADPGREAALAKVFLISGLLYISHGENQAALEALQSSAELARKLGENRLLLSALSLETVVNGFLGNIRADVTVLEEWIGQMRASNDAWIQARALDALAAVARLRGDFRTVGIYIEKSIQISRRSGDLWNTAMALRIWGLVAEQEGNLDEAEQRLKESLSLYEKVRDKNRANIIRSEMAHLELHRGHFEQAYDIYGDTILAWKELGHRGAVAHQLECIAFITSRQGALRRATVLFGAAEALREAANSPMMGYERDDYDRWVAALRQGQEEASFLDAWAEGRGMSMEAAIDLAIGEHLVQP